MQTQCETSSRKHSLWVRNRNSLLKRHPVVLPVLLLLGAYLASIGSFSMENAFPLLALLGISSTSVCFSIALVLGISGILASIIGILERFDRRSIQTAMFPDTKEQKLC